MSYCFSTVVNSEMDPAIKKVTQALQAEGFGILSEIDVKATLKKKIDVDFRPYVILGACNPAIAHKALLAESKIGTMLPCNVVVQEIEAGRIEISAVDPIASMSAIANPDLGPILGEVRAKLKKIIDSL